MSTRNHVDSFTAYRALSNDYTPDGGLFVPYRLPVFSSTDLGSLNTMSFGECVAHVLNLFFSAGLTGMDVDFAIGRQPVKINTMNHRLQIAELWHNPQLEYSFVEKVLYNKLCENTSTKSEPTNWAKIAIRIACLFGVYDILKMSGITNIDIAGITSDYRTVVAVYYAKKMGLPIGKIICVDDENGGIWDLFHKGYYSFSEGKRSYDLKALEICDYAAFEVWLYEHFGLEKVKLFLRKLENHGSLCFEPEELQHLNQSIEGVVVRDVRCQSLIRNIFRTYGYVPDPYTAIAFGGLQDYRARTGESRSTLLLSDFSASSFDTMTAKSLGVSLAEFRKLICNS